MKVHNAPQYPSYFDSFVEKKSVYVKHHRARKTTANVIYKSKLCVVWQRKNRVTKIQNRYLVPLLVHSDFAKPRR